MSAATSGNWWSRNFWVIVLFPVLAAVLLAGVSILRGWLHQRAGFDEQGRPLNGAATTAETKPRPVVSEQAAYQHIVADLQRRDPDTRPRLRYLTLVQRHNDPSCTAADLETTRQAVRELVALLWRGQTARLDFIDPEQLIFRIDLEDFNWDAATDWYRVGAQYRYGLSGGGEPLAKLRQQVAQATDEKIAVVRADWFVVALTRPPLAGAKGLLPTPAKELPEAIRIVNRQYAAQTLDLAACARELGVGEKAVTDLIREHRNLQMEFGLAPLLQGERIRREWWESDRNFFSPFQELARLLKVGTPIRVQ